MKKILFATVLSLLWLTTAMAQEQDPWVGTWTGIFRVMLDDEYPVDKVYIRIKKYGDKYNVQVKEAYTYFDQSSKTFYWDQCYNVTVNGNTIRWKSFSHQTNDNGHWRCNGKVIDVAKFYKICSATLDNGILHFSEAIDGELYDKNGNKIGEHHQPSFPIKDLYKDDEDW